MKWSFGIITAGDHTDRVQRLVDSIDAQNIPLDNYEIIVVGRTTAITSNVTVRHLPFDDTERRGWITRKKNMVTDVARYDNICYLHDYLALDKDWYKGFKKFGKFDVAVSRMLNNNGHRYRDYCACPDGTQDKKLLVPYDVAVDSKHLYVSGAYWVAKKKVMQDVRLNEDLVAGQGEDIEWSKRMRDKYKLSFNPYSVVHLCLFHRPVFTLMDRDAAEKMK